MPLLDTQASDEIRRIFEELDQPVTLVFYTRRASPLYVPGLAQEECESCEDEEALLTELAALSDRLHLETHDLRDEADDAREAGVERAPTLVLKGASVPGQIRFLGLPAGYEFSTLVTDIVDVSRANVELSAGTREELAALREPVHIQVFVTPT